MNLFLRFSAITLLVMGLAAGVAYVCPDCLVAVGLDFRNVRDLEHAFKVEMDRSHKLQEELNQLQENAKGKDEVLQDLIAGRVGLVAAAAQIGSLCDREQTQLAMDSLDVHGRTEEERLCRFVILWTDVVLQDSPTEAARVKVRLEKQLAEHIRQTGSLRLP